MRQRPITEAKIINWLNQAPEEFCEGEMLRNYKRNEMMIDLTKIPETLQKNIIDTLSGKANFSVKNLKEIFDNDRKQLEILKGGWVEVLGTFITLNPRENPGC